MLRRFLFTQQRTFATAAAKSTVKRSKKPPSAATVSSPSEEGALPNIVSPAEVETEPVAPVTVATKSKTVKNKAVVKETESTTEVRKNQNEALAVVLAKIDKAYGKGTVMQVGQKPLVSSNRVISTGSFAIDEALGIGGLPMGRIIEIFGPEASGKTSIALSTIAQAQKNGGKCMFVDAEHALDSDYAKGMGVNLNDLYITQPDCGEDALEIVDNVLRSGAMSVIVVDSVSALVPRAEIEGEMGDEKIGVQARLMSRAMRKLTPSVSKTSTVLIFINQIRLKIGVMFGSPETTSGGQALKFYASVRLDVRKSDVIKGPGGEAVGTVHKVKVVKNKVGPPFRVAEFSMKFGKGISKMSELIDAGVTYGLIETKGAYYYVTHPDCLPPNTDKLPIGQGREKAVEYLTKDPELVQKLTDAIQTIRALKNPLIVDESESDAELLGLVEEEAEASAETIVTVAKPNAGAASAQ